MALVRGTDQLTILAQKFVCVCLQASPAVEVTKFSFAYGSGGGKDVLKDVSFVVPRGARVLIVGLNG